MSGDHGAALGEQNRKQVLDWFLSHPGGSKRECARQLGLSEMAVGRHCKILRRDWPVKQPPSVEEPLSTRRHWVIVHEPGRIPDKKGPFPNDMVNAFVRELLDCRPAGTRAIVCSLTWDFDLWVEDGRARLSIEDALAAVPAQVWETLGLGEDEA